MSGPPRPAAAAAPILAAEAPLLLASLLILGLLLQTFAARVAYPFDLEWMEGGMLLHARRVMAGQPLYVEPSPEFIPFIYPPLYHWLLGWTAKAFGLSYALGRTLSLLGTLAAAAALAVAVRKEGEGRGWALGLGAGALYLTGYDDTGAFYDLVRTDGVVMGLLAWALVAGRMGWARAAGLLLTAAYLAKHNAAAFGVPMLWWLWRVEGRAAGLRFAAWSILPALAATVAIQLSGDRLFLTYLLGVPAGHPLRGDRLLNTPVELWQFAPLVVTAAAGAGLARLAGRRIPGLPPQGRLSAGSAYWLACGGLALPLTALMRAHHGGYDNVLMPGIWIVALWGALALGWLRTTWPSLWMRAATAILLAGQLWQGRWSPEAQLPHPDALAQGQALIETLRGMEGPILAPHSPWYPVMAGKETSFHLIALWDIDHSRGPLADRIAPIEAAMAEQRWGSALLGQKDLGSSTRDGYGFRAAYERDRDTKLPETRHLRPITGYAVRPQALYRPRTAPPPPRAPAP